MEAFLVNGETHELWFGSNRDKNRFFVANIERVIGDLQLEHTRCGGYFTSAKKIIYDTTKWPEQYPFEYECSHTHIYPEKRNVAKTFARAATIIIAMEIAAKERKPEYNVYDHLRILPAQYFVDRFDKEKFLLLKTSHDAMSSSERTAKFGVDEPFIETCLKQIDQAYSDRLLEQIVAGHCVTKLVAEKISVFINANYPTKCSVGPVLSAGESSVSQRLGIKNAAPALRIPKTLVLSQATVLA